MIARRASGSWVPRVLHDEARRDLALEAGLGPLLALDLVEQPARGRVGGLALEHRPEVRASPAPGRRGGRAGGRAGAGPPGRTPRARLARAARTRRRAGPAWTAASPSPFRSAGSSGVSVSPWRNSSAASSGRPSRSACQPQPSKQRTTSCRRVALAGSSAAARPNFSQARGNWPAAYRRIASSVSARESRARVDANTAVRSASGGPGRRPSRQPSISVADDPSVAAARTSSAERCADGVTPVLSGRGRSGTGIGRTRRGARSRRRS